MTSHNKINEKSLTGHPSDDLSFLLHSMFGLDHYPNYLLKWSNSDIERLESLLKKQLSKVRDAKTTILHRQDQLKMYHPVKPEFWSSLTTEPHIAIVPETLEAIRASKSGSLKKLDDILQDEAEFVYSVPLLRRDVCEMILREVDNFSEFATSTDIFKESQWLTKRHAALRNLKLDSLELILLNEVIRPISALVYPHIYGDTLDFHYGYVISYTDADTLHRHRQEDQTINHVQSSSNSKSQNHSSSNKASPGHTNVTHTALTSHTDDSEVTLNCCLGNPNFTGGDIIFRHLRNSGKDDSEEVRLHPDIGRAVIHLGQHLHQVSTVEKGDRHSLIVWTRSTKYRSETCPCCLIHRRVDCICDQSWN